MTYLGHDRWGMGEHSIAKLPPSTGDLFCVTTVHGKAVLVDPITAYTYAVQRAEWFLRRIVHPVPVVIKVLCVTLVEAQALGLAPRDLFRDQTPEDDAAMRQAALNACMGALHNSPDARVRADAIEMLTNLGVMR
jgi:hypothetical protein